MVSQDVVPQGLVTVPVSVRRVMSLPSQMAVNISYNFCILMSFWLYFLFFLKPFNGLKHIIEEAKEQAKILASHHDAPAAK